MKDIVFCICLSLLTIGFIIQHYRLTRVEKLVGGITGWLTIQMMKEGKNPADMVKELDEFISKASGDTE
jgi:hypothetical protein